MKMLIAFGLLFSTPLYAEEVVSSLYNCTHKDTSLVRQVMITHQYPGCHVTYIKADETGNKTSKVLWRAKNSTNYCDNKGFDFVEETLQKKYGWVCVDENDKQRIYIKTGKFKNNCSYQQLTVVLQLFTACKVHKKPAEPEKEG